MTHDNSIERIDQLVGQLARRVRVQRVVQTLTTAITVQLLLVALLVVLATPGWIDEPLRNGGIILTFLIPLAAAIAAWLRPIDRIALAQALDRAHGLHDRLSTALFLSKTERTAFEDAQIRDASRYLESVDVRQAAPWHRPTEWVALVIAVAVFAGGAMFRAPDHRGELPAEVVIPHDRILDEATLALERERVDALKQALEEAKLDDTEELVAELNSLLDRAEKQQISDKEFLEKLNEIEKKYLEKPDDGQDELAEKLKEAAEALEKELGKDLAKEPEAKALVEALKEKDYDKAAEAMSALAKKLQDPALSSKQLERLAKLMEEFSDLIDPKDPALQKLIEQNQALVDKLQKLFDQNKLSDTEKNRLNDLKKKADELNKKRKGNEGTLVSRQLKQLQRKTKEMADQAKKAADQKKGAKSQPPSDGEKKPNFQEEAGRKAEEASKQMTQQGEEQKKSEARKAAQKQLEELREAMQRSRVSRDSKSQESESEQQKGSQMKEFLERAKGKKQGDADHEAKTSEDGSDGQPLEAKRGDDPRGEEKSTGANKSDSQGRGEGERELSDATKLNGKRVDEKLTGDKGDGATRAEVIKSASEEGFATTEYKDVYVDYESVVEEVMEKENVPKGYRFYIKRYFQLIRPQE